MVSISIHSDLDRLVQNIERFQAAAPITVSNEVIRQVRTLSEKGKQPDGSSFAPYTPQYAKVREKKGLQVTPVNLRVTNGLMASLADTYDTEEHIVTVDTAHEEIAEGLSTKRTFLDVASQTVPDSELALKQLFDSI